MIILERDGSLHHYPPGKTRAGWQRASYELQPSQAQPSLVERILGFTSTLFGPSNLEMRINEQPKR